MGKIEDNLYNAMAMVAEKAVKEASFDKTIKATVLTCEDESIGKYKVRYQDSFFYAYSTDVTVHYSAGSNVYILVPGNDMSANKTIVGSVDTLGLDYLPNEDNKENFYEDIGNNCITEAGEFALCSYRPEMIVLYDAEAQQNLIKIDETSTMEYLRQSSSLKCGAMFKTALPVEQQGVGNFGIVFTLAFYDNKTQAKTEKTFTIDVDNMIGSPYKMELGKRQYDFFDIDGANFYKIKKISIFAKDFPHEEKTGKKNDIFISQIELGGAVLLPEEDRNGCGIKFHTPRGTFFAGEDKTNPDLKLPITAEVFIKGKKIKSTSPSLFFYWFVEDFRVTNSDNENYNKYGKTGWRCLNKKNIIMAEDKEKHIPAQIEWIPHSDTIDVYQQKSNTDPFQIYFNGYQSKFKCVIVYKNMQYSKTIVLKKLYEKTEITIESDLGSDFYYDLGKPTLTCLINGKREERGYIYKWAREDIHHNLTYMPETDEENETFQSQQTALENIKKSIKNETILPNAAADLLEKAESDFNKINNKQRVKGNQIIKLDMNTVYKLNVFKCAVYKTDGIDTNLENAMLIGTAEYTITNQLDAQDVYTLVINNGIQTFQYDEYGLSPTSPSKVQPLILEPLTFSIYDNKGRAIEEEVLEKCDVTWEVPKEHTLLDPDKYNAQKTDENGNIKDLTVAYCLKNIFDYKATNNNISLTVIYKGMYLKARTDFSFLKQGDSGTNGTQYTGKIIPNIINSSIDQLYPTFTIKKNESSQGYFNFAFGQTAKRNLTTREYSDESPFKALLFKNGEEMPISAISTQWSILKNQYKSNISDLTVFEIDEKTGRMKLHAENFKLVSEEIWDKGQVFANILQCRIEYEDEQSKEKVHLYTHFPLILCGVLSDNFIVNLKYNTGFQSVLYSNKGDNPQYDNVQPFTAEVQEEIEGQYETISDLTKNQDYIVFYEWSVRGQSFDYGTDQIKTTANFLHNLLPHPKDGESAMYGDNDKQTYTVIPSKHFNGSCVTNSVLCYLYQGNNKTLIGWLYIPVHCLFNRYAFPHLNDWNGTSIQINKDGGYILTPQVGAGIKNPDNSFTGVLMGKVQEPLRTTVDIGLLGYNQGERTFKLDAQNGSAIFGAKQGQIVIDPSAKRSLIYSYNYFDSYGNNGLPTSYENHAKNGMMIDLSTPEIRFGNGNFIVNSDGHITAKGGGSIAGWKIEDHELHSDDAKTGMNSMSNENDTEAKVINVPLPSGDSKKAIAFWAGGTSKPKFYVTHDGYLCCNDATIGSGSNKIYIGKDSYTSYSKESAIYSGAKSSWDSDKEGFYLGTKGLYLGKHFWVTSEGELTARSGYIGNNTDGWKINYTSITNGKDTYSDAKEGAYLGTDGIGLGKGTFYVDKKGQLTSTKGFIGGWSIKEDSLSSLGSNNQSIIFSVIDFSRSINSKVRYGLRLAAGSKFAIANDGTLYASNADISGTINATSGVFSNITIDETCKIGGSNAATAEQIDNLYKYFTSDNAEDAKLVETKRISASSGEIGGWIIEEGRIKSTDGSVVLNSTDSMITISAQEGQVANTTTLQNGKIDTTLIKAGLVEADYVKADSVYGNAIHLSRTEAYPYLTISERPEGGRALYIYWSNTNWGRIDDE